MFQRDEPAKNREGEDYFPALPHYFHPPHNESIKSREKPKVYVGGGPHLTWNTLGLITRNFAIVNYMNS